MTIEFGIVANLLPLFFVVSEAPKICTEVNNSRADPGSEDFGRTPPNFGERLRGDRNRGNRPERF